MALRIGGARPAPQVEEEEVDDLPVEEIPEEVPVEEEPEPDGDEGLGGSVEQSTAGYLGPEHGPFMCGNCMHYLGAGKCDVVSGEIDEQGCCNLFEAVPPGDEAEPVEESYESDEASYESAEEPEPQEDK